MPFQIYDGPKTKGVVNVLEGASKNYFLDELRIPIYTMDCNNIEKMQKGIINFSSCGPYLMNKINFLISTFL